MKKGLNSFGENRGSGFLSMKNGDTKVIRFLEEGDVVTVVPLHYLNIPGHEGNVICLGKGCPLCANASEKWGGPISKAGDAFFTKVIERSKEGKNIARLFKGTRGVAGALAVDFVTNKSITGVDYSYSRVLEKGKTRYKLSAIHSTFSKLSPEEVEMGNSLNSIEEVLNEYKKTKDELDEIINDYKNINSTPKEIKGEIKSEEVDEELPF